MKLRSLSEEEKIIIFAIELKDKTRVKSARL